MNYQTKFALALTLACAALNVAAAPFSRAETGGARVDTSEGAAVQPVDVKGLVVYSFLGDVAAPNSRLGRDTERFRVMLGQTVEQRGVRVSSLNVLADGAQLAPSTTTREIGGTTTTLSDAAKADAFALARSHHDEEKSLPATHRLILLSERLVHNNTVYTQWWGPKGITTTSSGVPSYAFKVYWELEDVADHPIAAGYTSAMLDIRGFPAKDMTNQILAELERLGVHWVKATDSTPTP